jgi:hypothetical protein
LEENNKCVLELVKKTYIWGQGQSCGLGLSRAIACPNFFIKNLKCENLYILFDLILNIDHTMLAKW